MPPEEPFCPLMYLAEALRQVRDERVQKSSILEYNK
jgi:hypothetical protein